MQFTYKARDASGRIRTGELSAAAADEAKKQLRQEGLFLLSLEEVAQKRASAGPSLFQKRIARAEIIYLTNQLAVMIDAGVPLATALAGLAKQSDNPTLKSLLEQIEEHVQAGESFSSALARFPKYFDTTYVNLVKASEASGTLAPMLDRISAQAQSELETRQKVKGALMYPVAMLVMCVGVSIFLLVYVFPKLTPMFATRQIEIPTPTKVMMALSEALTGYWYVFVIAGGTVVGFVVWMRTRRWGRKALDWMWLHLPVLGPMLRKVALGRSVRTLATTVNAGVPVLEAIELCAGVANNVLYEESWLAAGERVAAGRQIHEALEDNKLFPATLLQMIASGESTGKLGNILNKVGEYYEREIANAVKAATSLIEPVMVFVMGGVIGSIALAMLLPIFKLSSHVG
jgi:type IV pilus assembly protein PilC